MFGFRKSRKAVQAVETFETARAYDASEYAPHGVAIRWDRKTSHWSRPTVWEATRSGAENLAANIRREHPEWDVQVVRK